MAAYYGPGLDALMDDAKADVFTLMSFSTQHRSQLCSTNLHKRLNREIKWRSDVVDIFPNEVAIICLVCVLLFEQNDEWAMTHRYLTLETLGTVSDTCRHQPVTNGCLPRRFKLPRSNTSTPPLRAQPDRLGVGPVSVPPSQLASRERVSEHLFDASIVAPAGCLDAFDHISG